MYGHKHADLRRSRRRHISNQRPPPRLDLSAGGGGRCRRVLQPSRPEGYARHGADARPVLQLDVIGLDVFDDRIETW